VIVESCVLRGGFDQPGVRLDDATGVALQRCAVTGTPGLLVSNGSEAVAGRGALDALTVEGRSDITVCQLVPGTTDVEFTSRLTRLSGVMPDLQHHTFNLSGSLFELRVETSADGLFAVFVSTHNEWARIPGIDMASLLPLSLLIPFGNGVANPLGSARLFFDLPPNSALQGLPFTTQLANFDATTATLRFSNAKSFVIFP
jgi:hypothetical protein